METGESIVLKIFRHHTSIYFQIDYKKWTTELPQMDYKVAINGLQSCNKRVQGENFHVMFRVLMQHVFGEPPAHIT